MLNIQAQQKQQADISRDIVLLSRLLESCLTPSPTWKFCQAVAIHIRAELSEGETQTAEDELEEAKEEPIPRKREQKRWKTSRNNHPAL